MPFNRKLTAVFVKRPPCRGDINWFLVCWIGISSPLKWINVIFTNLRLMEEVYIQKNSKTECEGKEHVLGMNTSKHTIGWVSRKWDRKPFYSRTTRGLWEREKQVPEMYKAKRKRVKEGKRRAGKTQRSACVKCLVKKPSKNVQEDTPC